MFKTKRTLYYHILSPFSRAVRIHLFEKNLLYTAKIEKPLESSAELALLNNAKTAPVLVDENMMVLANYYAISEYLEEGYVEHNFIGKTLIQRAEVRRLSSWFNIDFYREIAFPILSEKYYRRCMCCGEPASDVIREAKKQAKKYFAYLSRLLDDRQWIAGDFLSLADFTIAAQISTLDYLGDINWEKDSNIKDWYAIIKSRPSMRDILKDRVRGFCPPPHYANPDF